MIDLLSQRPALALYDLNTRSRSRNEHSLPSASRAPLCLYNRKCTDPPLSTKCMGGNVWGICMGGRLRTCVHACVWLELGEEAEILQLDLPPRLVSNCLLSNPRPERNIANVTRSGRVAVLAPLTKSRLTARASICPYDPCARETDPTSPRVPCSGEDTRSRAVMSGYGAVSLVHVSQLDLGPLFVCGHLHRCPQLDLGVLNLIPPLSLKDLRWARRPGREQARRRRRQASGGGAVESTS